MIQIEWKHIIEASQRQCHIILVGLWQLVNLEVLVGSQTLWTTKRAMQSWNTQRYIWGGPIPVGFAFKRPWEGGHSNQSQHYAGVAFDVAQGWTNARRASLRNSAKTSGVWSYVEPVSITPTWVHFDKRFRKACMQLRWIPTIKKRKHQQLCFNCPRWLKYTWVSDGRTWPEYLDQILRMQCVDTKQAVDLHQME